MLVFNLMRWSSFFSNGISRVPPYSFQLGFNLFRLQDFHLLRLSFPNSFIYSLLPRRWLRFLQFRSSLLSESLLLSFPLPTKIFQFGRFRPSFDVLDITQVCSHIRIPTDRCLLTAPRSVSPFVASFFAFMCLGIHCAPFFSLTFFLFFD